jgi:hypothetical protein
MAYIGTKPANQVIDSTLIADGTVTTADLANGVTINFADGSVSTQSITNDGDTNTGIFFPAADTIAFAEGGAEVARFSSSGNLGIGNNNPGYQLSLYKNDATYLELINSQTGVSSYFGSSGLGAWIGTSSSHPTILHTNNTERMRIDSSGRVTMPYQPAFRATKDNGGGSGAGTAIVFNTVNTNIGSHYNNSTGLFTAPVAGMYQFNFSGITYTVNTDITIEVNGNAVAWTYSYIGSQTYLNLSMSVAVYMSAGDSARVYVRAGSVYVGGDGGAPRFSGFLIG